jgi:hypothetical protein
MASLEEDLYEAFVGATVGDQYGFGTDEGKTILIETEEDDGKIKELAHGIATAIHEWITKQTFTIIEMKAVAEIEKFRVDTVGGIKMLAGIPTAGSPAAQVTTAPGQSMPINLSKSSGLLSTFGHAYIGSPATTVKGAAGASDTSTGQWNTYSKVKLNPKTKKDLYIM